MFTKKNNASKFGFITLVQKLATLGYMLIDCQQETKHLTSLGGRSIPRKEFLKMLEQNLKEKTEVGNWATYLGNDE